MAFSNTAPLRRADRGGAPAATVRDLVLGRDDGPATEPDAPTFRLLSPQALAHVVRAPGELGLGRAFVLGLIDVEDMDIDGIERALRVVDTFEPPRLAPRQIARARRRRACAPAG